MMKVDKNLTQQLQTRNVECFKSAYKQQLPSQRTPQHAINELSEIKEQSIESIKPLEMPNQIFPRKGRSGYGSERSIDVYKSKSLRSRSRSSRSNSKSSNKQANKGPVLRIDLPTIMKKQNNLPTEEKTTDDSNDKASISPRYLRSKSALYDHSKDKIELSAQKPAMAHKASVISQNIGPPLNLRSNFATKYQELRYPNGQLQEQ